jgi:dimeric dUTPase (all-alpha-NTP-PPase superfamily)
MKKYIFTIVLSLFAIISISAQSKKDAQVSKLYQNYIAIKSALASDDADKTSKAAAEFIKTASAIDYKVVSEGNLNTLKKDATAISEARTITAQRETFFNLSDNMIALAKEFKLSESPIYVQYCPMADGSWLSDEKKIINPYYGSSMLSCGNVKSEIK